MKIAAVARYVHWRIRQSHSHAWHRAVTWPYRAVFGTVAPTGTMYDDIAASGDPTGGDGYAGYLNGKYADYDATKARFPDKPTKSISVWGTDTVALSADIADCENGDYEPVDAALWAHLKITGGYGRPTIYSSTSQYVALVAALAAYGLLFGRDVDWFEAHYDDLPMISSNPGAIGKQYQSTDDYDQSVVFMDWLTGHPNPDPPTPTEDDMAGITPAVQTSDGTWHRASIVYPGVLLHSWLNPGSPTWEKPENVAEVAGNGANPPSAAIAALTFTPDQVPTCQVVGSQLWIGAQTAPAGTSFDFTQTTGKPGWGAREVV